MSHTIYDNFYLSNEIEDQFNSHLDMQRFCTVDNSLAGQPGMLRKINVYQATDATEKLGIGEGNTGSIEVSFTPREYRIQLAQNRFKYYDEQAMTDPMLVPTGVRHMGTDMFNTVNADIFAEFNKATKVVVTNTLNFNCFADAQSMYRFSEDIEGKRMFAFVSPSDVATLRKNLKDDLKYVEAFVRAGYIGTVAGVDIFSKQDAIPGTICTADQKAVTLFNKKGTEVEQIGEGVRSETAANVRENTIFARKYYIAALTDEREAVKIVKGTATETADTSVNNSKTYYAQSGLGYVKVTPTEGANPASEGWYEISADF
ncbi:MAG: hypothetical protein IK072_01895 [Clostridia bacterium]|nr:hypothetical protein [Clostridia bacterium]